MLVVLLLKKLTQIFFYFFFTVFCYQNCSRCQIFYEIYALRKGKLCWSRINDLLINCALCLVVFLNYIATTVKKCR